MSLRVPTGAAYERKAVLLLAAGFGLVFLDRWIIAPLFPSMMTDLKLSYQDLGNLAGVTGVSWGVFAMITGRVSDRIGRRWILIPMMILFSLLSGLSGLAGGLMGLLLIRGILGICEGCYCPASFAAVADASEPKRLGFNMGLQQCAGPLLGSGLGPIIATQLLRVVPSWRWVFLTVSVPGLVLAFLLYRTIREPHLASGQSGHALAKWGDIFRSRNLILATAALLCCFTAVIPLSAMLPNYLVDYLHLSSEQMGFVMSAIGFGGFTGQLVLPALSDFLGRRTVAVLGFLGATLSVYVLARTGANPTTLFAILFLASAMSLGSLGLLTGPIAVESAPVGMVSSAVGMVVGIGEVFGGGFAPAVAGYIAQRSGIEHTLDLAGWGLAAGVLVSLFLKETAPRKSSATKVGRAATSAASR